MFTIDFVVARSAVARELGEPQHRVDQILNTRQHIRPLRRVGIVRAHALEAGDRGPGRVRAHQLAPRQGAEDSAIAQYVNGE